MEMEAIVNMIVNSSVSIIVIAYFMYRDFKYFAIGYSIAVLSI